MSEFEQMVDLRVAQTSVRLKKAKVGPEIQASALALIKASEYPSLDESRLWSEWRNIVALMTADEFREVEASPSTLYLNWIQTRISSPYTVDNYMMRRLLRKFTAEFTNELVMRIWPGELAWARRLRNDQSDEISVTANLFLVAVVRDPLAEIINVAESHLNASHDMGYFLAKERSYTPAEIRNGYLNSGFRPAFLRHAEAAFEARILKIEPNKLSAMAEKARRDEQRELMDMARERAMIAAMRMPLSRIGGVITVALERKMTSDDLVRAERDFIQALKKGTAVVSSNTRYPHAEFVDYLRTRTKHPEQKGEVRSSILDVIINTRKFIDTLPNDFTGYGSRNRDKLSRWIEKVQAMDVQPLDLVVDYGMDLIKQYAIPSMVGEGR